MCWGVGGYFTPSININLYNGIKNQDLSGSLQLNGENQQNIFNVNIRAYRSSTNCEVPPQKGQQAVLFGLH